MLFKNQKYILKMLRKAGNTGSLLHAIEPYTSDIIKSSGLEHFRALQFNC